MEWTNALKTIAPTVASALLGPLGGTVVEAIGEIIGLEKPTQGRIQDAIEKGRLTAEQIGALKELELKLQAEEQERGFRYSELEFKDRDSARNLLIQTGAKTPAVLTWIIVSLVLGLEGALLFGVGPSKISDIVLGRILGTLDTSLAMVLSFWFGTTHGSSRKTDLMAQGVK